MTGNKSEEIWKVSSRVQSITSNSLTVTLNAAKRYEESQDEPPKQQDETYLGLPI